MRRKKVKTEAKKQQDKKGAERMERYKKKNSEPEVAIPEPEVVRGVYWRKQEGGEWEKRSY